MLKQKVNLIGAFLLVICILKNDLKSQNPSDFQQLDNAINYYVIGDWGRHGEYNQKELAEMMGKVAEIIEPDFIISTGDNFYPEGVQSIYDDHWKKSFEDIYTSHLIHRNWYCIFGNHDYNGNVDAQIEYTNISRRWQAPARYYTISKKIKKDASVDFVFIDTNPFIRDYHKNNEKYNVAEQDTNKQYKWIDEQLKNSKANWKIVVGHHPIYTGGVRKPSQPELVEKLAPILDKHNVPLYVSGHEHDLQIIEPPTNKFVQIVSGAGSAVRPAGETNGTIFSKSIQGFMIFSMTKDEILIQSVDYKGNVLHKYTLKK